MPSTFFTVMMFVYYATFFFPSIGAIIGIFLNYESTLVEALLSLLVGFIPLLLVLGIAFYLDPANYLTKTTIFSSNVLFLLGTVFSFWSVSYKRLSQKYDITMAGWWRRKSKWKLKEEIELN